MAKEAKRAVGRPPKPHRVMSFKLSLDVVDWLDKASERTGKTKTALVEEAVQLLKKQQARRRR